MTIVAGIFCALVLPDWPGTTKWLTDAEKRLAAQRIAADKIGATGVRELGHWRSLVAAVSDWRLYVYTFMFMMIGEPRMAFVLSTCS